LESVIFLLLLLDSLDSLDSLARSLGETSSWDGDVENRGGRERGKTKE